MVLYIGLIKVLHAKHRSIFKFLLRVQLTGLQQDHIDNLEEVTVLKLNLLIMVFILTIENYLELIVR